MSATLSRGLQSEICRRFCESVVIDSRDSRSRDGRRDGPKRDLRNFFFTPQSGDAHSDFEGAGAAQQTLSRALRESAHVLFGVAEASISQALLRLHQDCADAARIACRARRAIAWRRPTSRAVGARDVATYTFR
jgi:hypothetical protein